MEAIAIPDGACVGSNEGASACAFASSCAASLRLALSIAFALRDLRLLVGFTDDEGWSEAFFSDILATISAKILFPSSETCTLRLPVEEEEDVRIEDFSKT